MTFLNTQHKKRSFTITTILLVLLLLLMFYIGLGYTIPPPETGISVNFGTENVGSDAVQPKEEVKTTPQEEEVQDEQTEDLLAGDEEDAPVIPPKKPKPKPKEKTPSKSTQDALSNILNSPKSDGKSDGSEGNDTKAGDKGQAGGDPYANSYYGPGTSGTGVTYGLKGRALVSTGKVEQECNEEGRVVVEIKVDKNGKVISAVPGKRGTTNNHPCLLEPAKKTALMYKWNFDSDAPALQIGFVVINFKLGG